MADLASDRITLQDISLRRAGDGARVVKVLPWQVVTYGNTGGLEPVDIPRMEPSLGAAETDKEITGVQGMESDRLLAAAGTAGDVGFPVG